MSKKLKVAFIILFLIFFFQHTERIANAVKFFDAGIVKVLFFSIFSCALVPIIWAIRINLINKMFNIDLTLYSVYRLNLKSIFLNTFSVSGVGDIYRIKYYNLSGINLEGSMLSAFFDRFVGLTTQCFSLAFLMFFFPYPINVQFNNMQFAIFISLIFAGVLVAIFFKKKFMRFFSSLTQSIGRILSLSKIDLIIPFLLSILLNAIWVLPTLLIMDYLELNLSLFVKIEITMLVMILSTLPLSIAGIGVREIGFVALLSPLGVTVEQSFIVGNFSWVVNLVNPIVYLFIDSITQKFSTSVEK